MKVKIDRRDKLFSLYIRTRAHWICEACGKYYGDKRMGLHCSHLWSRRHRGTRWDPDNAFAHCFGCHQKFGSNPVMFHDWAKDRLGEQKFEALRVKAHKITKLSAFDIMYIEKELKQKLADLEAA